MRSLDEIAQNFYRSRDVTGLDAALEGFFAAPTPNLALLHLLARMVRLSPEALAAVERFRAREPRFVEAVVRGFDDPTFPRVGEGPPSAEELDLLWSEFFATGERAPVLRIVAVLDEPDVTRERLSRWLQELGTGFFGKRTFQKYLEVFARCHFPIDVETRRIDGPVDLDISVGLTARAGQLKFAELPFPLSQDELLRLATKCTAVWSLKDLAKRHERLFEWCLEEARRPGGAGRLLLARPEPG